MNASSSLRQFPLHKHRLNKPYMYKQVFEGGKVLRSAPLTLRIFFSDDQSRLGFIIRKKVGNACMRNSIRRTLRESFRQALPHFPASAWIVFDVANKASSLRRSELRAQADAMLQNLRTLQSQGAAQKTSDGAAASESRA